jgi:F-type H+-transporting ATPase subunit b
MIAFGVFVWFCMKYVWPPIVNALAERKTKIAEGLAAAERGHHEQELGQQRAKEIMQEAKQQAAELVSQAQKRASEIVEEAKGDGNAERARILTAATAEIDQERNRAREELRGKVAELSVAAAEKILQKEIDAEANKAIVDAFAKQI